ncbi:MarR family transcriptional regulator [Psychrobacter faecalis]
MEDNNTKSHSVLLYNTQNIDAQLLKAGFSIRKKEYQRIWKDITTSSMAKPETHYLIQGVRGAGKTTLLSRLYYEVAEYKELKKWLVPILLNEEEYGILSLFTFWLRIAEKLAEHDSDLYAQLFEQVTHLDDSAEMAWELIQSHLDKNKQKIIVFVDNLGELFKDFDEIEHAQLREVLSLRLQIRLVGGSSQLLEAHFDGEAPFYQFFKLVNLKPINEAEMHELLRSLAKQTSEEAVKTIEEIITEHPQRIEAVRRLTDGVPRTIVLLFQIIMEGAKESSYAYLEETIDKTTPLYKHRMDDLSRQQKAIVHVIAMNWDAMSTKEIAEQTRLPSKTVSAQLVKLQKQWIIDKVETDTKNHLYIVKERFFNIWYLMRYGNQNEKRRVLWLTRFLESWCDERELSTRFVEAAFNIENNQTNISDVYFNALLASEKIDSEIKKSIINSINSKDKVGVVDYQDSGYRNIEIPLRELINKNKIDKAYQLLENNFKNLTIKDYLFNLHTLFLVDEEKFIPEVYGLKLFQKTNFAPLEASYLLSIVFNNNFYEYKEVFFKILSEVIKNVDIDLGRIAMVHSYCIYSLWNNDLESFKSYFEKIKKVDFLDELSKIDNEDMFYMFFENIIIMLLSKGQLEMCFSMVTEPEFKEELKPFYYATVSLLKDERQQEYLRMGPELQGTVDEILQKVEEYRVKYT